ncbi:MAG: methylated-DNA-protein-cysteine methyltransferase related protein [Actinomycetota bacterium]|nr:methylated-DNA-protein-cysteine methyltransferase related protein [Actinomycetota bacterium]
MTSRGDFETRVKKVLGRLQPGEIATYGEIAEEAGYPRAARAVGTLLANDSEGLPWWRVVRADGSLAARHRDEQVRLLRSEGVRVVSNRVTL